MGLARCRARTRRFESKQCGRARKSRNRFPSTRPYRRLPERWWRRWRLGGRTDARLLQAATGEPAGAVVAGADPALDEGLLLSEPERSQLCGSATTGWAQGRSRS